MNKEPLLLLIDGNAIMNVFYYGSLPDELRGNDNPALYPLIEQNTDGVYVNAMQGFMRCLVSLVNTLKPSHMAVAFDIGTKTLRKKQCDFYKANRGEKPLPLKEQLDITKYWLRKMHIPVYVSEDYEGDDIISTIAHRECSQMKVLIATTDHDYYQMVNDNVNVMLYIPNQKSYENLKAKYPNRCILSRFVVFNRSMVQAEVGVLPEQIPEYKGLAGDTADNIPGVKGIADITAVKLLSLYQNIGAIYADIQNLKADQLISNWKQAGMTRPKYIYEHLANMDAAKSASISRKLAITANNVPVGMLDDNLKISINKKVYADFMAFISRGKTAV